MSSPQADNEKKHVPTLEETLKAASKRALGGGVPGAMAMFLQVLSLMWLRTTMNYQYRHGTTTATALKTLYKEGGILRFYRGVGPALIQGPLSRFGDTAANAGVLALLEHESTKNWPTVIKTFFASQAAAMFRILLMPVDTTKTILQVEGKHGLSILKGKIRKNGVGALYYGALGAYSATFVGHYPWFTTFNLLDKNLPKTDEFWLKLMRRAALGFCASVVSDSCSNSIRVMKTYKQTHSERITYSRAFKEVIAQEGVLGLMGRGLKTRILANGLQGCLFSVLWKGFEDVFVKKFNL